MEWLLLLLCAGAGASITLQVVHLNDFQARYAQQTTSATPCMNASECIGGLPRAYTAIKTELTRNPNLVLLNAGNNYQGTLYYTLYRWNITYHFMNMVPWDALVVGNDEFDNGVAGLLPFLEHFSYPVVLANVNCSAEPDIAKYFVPYTIIERYNKSIGIIGYIIHTVSSLADTGNLAFFDELTALDLQGAILKSKGVDIIIGLSHAGIATDLNVANHSKYVDVIVGGHSHTLLYNGIPPLGTAYGTYPVVVTQSSGRRVLVVQASAYTRYLGNLTVEFDDEGEVSSWFGNPIYLSHNVTQDNMTLIALGSWTEGVNEIGSEVKGETRTTLDMTTHSCYKEECSLGNFVTDAMVDYYAGKGPEGSWTVAAVGLMNAGGLRVNIEQGYVTYANLLDAMPFGDTLDLVHLSGEHLLDLLEDSVGRNLLLQWSGVRVVYNTSESEGSRVKEVLVRCWSCSVPYYTPLDPNATYPLVVPSYVADGGDNYYVLTTYIQNRTTGPVDVDQYEAYLSKNSPIWTGVEGRQQFVS